MTLIALNGVKLADVQAALSEPGCRDASFGDGTGYWCSVSAIRRRIGGAHYGAVLGLLDELVNQHLARRHPSGGLYFQPARS